ncbi:MAG: ABC transporter ATP-binding protein [Gammaproteobacteria bacterium]|nr:ABC transporter ATP-binding protein [Gammaproteobacteria bacterium]MCY4254535.1 ABC transporter ATP-binding protein [Gammaproteobacteria bacterium]MCY4340951.1 ABC transporter ATP-binding protein [Gammaproteobacteria bacterium]
MNASTPLLRIRGLCVDFPRSGRVVHEVSLDADEGEIVGLVGESGAGKSLVALSILGLAPAPGRIGSGQVSVQGQDLTKIDEAGLRPLRGRLAGFVFQDPSASLNPVRRIGSALIESAMRHSRLSRKQARKRAMESLRSVELPQPESAMRAFPHQFSGGQRQRIMIALALINRPPLLIADEPTTALDAAVQSRILDLLKRRAKHHALLMITHDLQLAAGFCDRLYVMRGGRVVEHGQAGELFAKPRHEYTRSLLDALPGKRAMAPGRGKRPEQGKPEEALAALRGLTVRYQGARQAAVEQVDFSIHANETVCLVGESGSGKTTIARVLAGVIRAAPGQLRFPSLNEEFPAAEVRARHLQMVFQDPYSSLNPRWPVERIVAEPLRAHRLCGRAEQKERVAALLRRVGLDPKRMGRRPTAFSGGQRQRIALARALAMNPRLLLADEALSALDIRTQARILALLREIREERKLALLLITHDLALAAEAGDRVIVLRHGKIVEQGPASQVMNSPRHEYTRELLAAQARWRPNTG